LRRDGIVKTRRDGRHIYYSLASGEVAHVIGALCELGGKPVTRSPRGRN
jgi:DNA-binding transcriptional ArsR family regulator